MWKEIELILFYYTFADMDLDLEERRNWGIISYILFINPVYKNHEAQISEILRILKTRIEREAHSLHPHKKILPIHFSFSCLKSKVKATLVFRNNYGNLKCVDQK